MNRPPDLSRMVTTTLDLVRQRGPMPWDAGRSGMLTNTHREILRDLERDGLVERFTDKYGEDMVRAVGAPSPEERMLAEVLAVPSGCIFIVGSADLKALCQKALRDKRPGSNVYVVHLVPEFDRRSYQAEIALRLWSLMRFARPLAFSAGWQLSAAASLEVTEHNLAMQGRFLPDADQVAREFGARR